MSLALQLHTGFELETAEHVLELDEDQVEHTVRLEKVCPRCEHCFPSGMDECSGDGATLMPFSPSGRSLIGTVIDGRYAIRRLLGSGGMGAVYSGLQLSVERPVAIKVIHAQLGRSSSMSKRFLREAQLSGRLHHPNTVSVIDFGSTPDGLLYLVMERVEGRNLAEIAEQVGRMEPLRVAELGVQICSGLSAAHQQGIVHRDLKPANIMVCFDGVGGEWVKLLDFGIAKSLCPEDPDLTEANAVIGTPAYLSPEAIRGQAIDGRSDLYTLGLVLYELLAGRPPFDSGLPSSIAPTSERGRECRSRERDSRAEHRAALRLAYCHTQVEAPPLPSDVPPSLAAVVMQLLRKRPEDRFVDAAAAACALASAAVRPL